MKLSCVVIAYNMRREIVRTVQSLLPPMQRGVSPGDYEVIVVDNGSREPCDRSMFGDVAGNLRVFSMPEASQTPVPALNFGAMQARGDVIVSMVDGTRMASPGCIYWTMKAFELHADCVAYVPSWHLGPQVQNASVKSGYNQAVEDRLLDTVDWRADGYRLFDVAKALDPSSAKEAWFGCIWEANFIAVSRRHYQALGGYDPAFGSRGGGAVNLDFFRRAGEAAQGPLVALLGEGTFHQFHGGVSTNVATEAHPWNEIRDEYRRIRGRDLVRPQYDVIQMGHLGREARRWLIGNAAALDVEAQPTVARPAGRLAASARRFLRIGR